MSEEYERIFTKRLENSVRLVKYYVNKIWNDYINELHVIADINIPVSGMPEYIKDIIYKIEQEGMIRILDQIIGIDMLGTLAIGNNIDNFIGDMIETFKLVEREGFKPKYDLVRYYTYALPLTYMTMILKQDIKNVPIYIPYEKCITRKVMALTPECMCNFFNVPFDTCGVVEDTLYEIVNAYNTGMFSKAYLYSYYITNALVFYEVFYAIKYLSDLLFGEKT